jgi:hypothetical protein
MLLRGERRALQIGFFDVALGALLRFFHSSSYDLGCEA